MSLQEGKYVCDACKTELAIDRLSFFKHRESMAILGNNEITKDFDKHLCSDCKEKMQKEPNNIIVFPSAGGLTVKELLSVLDNPNKRIIQRFTLDVEKV